MLRPAVAVLLFALPLSAQSPPTQTRMLDALPSSVRTTQLVVTPDARRVYYTDTAHVVWFYDRTDKRNMRLADGYATDLALSPAGDAIAFARRSAGWADEHVFVLALDKRTGLAAGSIRPVSEMLGDSPSFSPDGKQLAFARNDSTGVGQSVVVVPTNGGRERVLASSFGTPVSNIRWSPDGSALYFGVNPPPQCDPEWSCLELKNEFKRTTGTVRRVSLNGGAPTIVARRTGNGWPGLSADGSLLVYGEAGSSRVVVADTTDRVVQTLTVPRGQTVEGWLNASTLVISDRGDVRRLRSYSIADGSSRVLADTIDQIFDPTISPDGRSISVQQCFGDRCSLRVLNSDGSPRTSVPLPLRYGGSAVWSPDSRYVAYFGAPPSGDRQIQVVDVAAGKVSTVATAKQGIIWLQWAENSRELIVSNTIGTGANRHVTFQRASLDAPSRMVRDVVIGLPPSGASILDATRAVVYSADTLRLTGFEGDTSSRTLLALGGGVYYGPTALSNGRLAMRHTADKNTDDLKIIDVMNADAGNHVRIEMPFSVFGGPSGLRFLPGGAQFVVIGEPTPEEPNVGVYLVTVATKNVKRLFGIPPQTFTGDLVLSPDGRSILYTTNDAGSPRVFTMDLSPLRAGMKH